MFKFRKRSLVLLMVMAMMLTAVVVGCGSEDVKEEGADNGGKKFINIATGGTAGVYYPLGGAVADVLNKNVDGINATAESTGASVANTNMLDSGEVQLAFIQNDISYYAINGTEMFKDNKVDKLRALATIYPETVQIVTLEKSGINSVADLKGKRVAVGASGSSVVPNSEQVLEVYGITFDDISPQYLSFAEAANGLKDGHIDAAFLSAGFPTAAIQDIASQHDVKVLSIDKDKAEQLSKKYPYYTEITIPKDTYNQSEDAVSVSIKAMLVVTEEMAEEDAYEITKAIFTNLDRIKAAHPVGEYMSVESAQDGLSIPLHAGAEKYFNEVAK